MFTSLRNSLDETWCLSEVPNTARKSPCCAVISGAADSFHPDKHMAVLRPSCDHMSRPTRRLELTGQKLKGVHHCQCSKSRLEEFERSFAPHTQVGKTTPTSPNKMRLKSTSQPSGTSSKRPLPSPTRPAEAKRIRRGPFGGDSDSESNENDDDSVGEVGSPHVTAGEVRSENTSNLKTSRGESLKVSIISKAQKRAGGI